MRRLLPGLLAAVGVVALAGCGGSREAEVSGTVNIDGKPLSEGEIIFEAADGSATPAAGPIREGKYSLRSLPGAKVVKITASRPTKGNDPVMGAAAREPRIGPEFNAKSKLTADLKPGSNDGVNFEVKGLP